MSLQMTKEESKIMMLIQIMNTLHPSQVTKDILWRIELSQE